MHCDERRNRHLRDLEIAGMTQAMNESQLQQMEESRAARRKYREERRARINQLFTPVRMILTEDNFIRSETREEKVALQVGTEGKADEEKEGDEASERSSKTPGESVEAQSSHSCSGDAKGDCDENYDSDNFVLVPKSGLPHGAAIYEFSTNINCCTIATNQSKTIQQKDDVELRKVPNECSICLCEYTVGSDIVWSSNPQCDHVFHTSCIEQWLMKQRDGPLCPCCRRDFVIDPFDLGRGEMDDLEKGVSSSVFASSSVGMMNTSAPAGRRNHETSPAVDGTVDGTVLVLLAASLANSMARIDESDGSGSDVPV